MKKSILILLVSIIIMSFVVVAPSHPEMAPGIELISPNGGEIFAIGDTVIIKYSGVDSKDFYLGIFLSDGPTPGFIASLNPVSASGEYKWKIPERILQGNVGISLQPGKYKIELILYDGKPCLGLCPEEYLQPRILAKDKSDDYFNIIKEGQNEQLITIPTTFSLNKGQTAKITNYQDMKIKLLEVIGEIRGSGDAFERPKVIVGVTIPGGCGPNADPNCLGPPEFYKEYTIYDGDSVNVLDKVKFMVLSVEKNKAEFKISFIENIPVYLNQKFNLELGRSAIVKDYNDMSITSSSINKNKLVLQVSLKNKLILVPQQPTAIKNNYDYYVGTSGSGSGVIASGSTMSLVIGIGESKEVFGATINLLDLENSVATLIVTKIDSNKPPVITSVGGPTSLKVNEMGKWSIEAYDPDGKYLKYSVNWGDDLIYPYAKGESYAREISQEATFTHSYSKAGTYKVVFTVTDDDGGKAQSSISVNVGDYDKWEEFSLKKGQSRLFDNEGIDVKLKDILIAVPSVVGYDESSVVFYTVEVEISKIGDSISNGVIKTLKIGEVVEFFNEGKLKLIDVEPIYSRRNVAYHIAKFGIRFDKTPIACSACMNGKPTGEYDEDGCMIFECPLIGCNERVLDCPNGELVNIGKDNNGCPSYECSTVVGCDAMVPYCPDGKLIKTGINEAGCTIWECSTINEKQCPQLGYRENGRYCNVNNAWEEQLNGGEFCDNDFECSSNSCLDSQCTEPGFWNKLFNLLSRLFKI